MKFICRLRPFRILRILQGPKGRNFADYAEKFSSRRIRVIPASPVGGSGYSASSARRKGQTIVEYLLLLGVSLGIFLLISRWGLKVLQGYFGFISFLYSGFMTLFP